LTIEDVLSALAEIGERTPTGAIAAEPARGSFWMSQLGVLAFSTGDYPIARKHFFDALTACQQIEDYHGTASRLTSIGIICERERRYGDAQTHYARALQLCMQLEDLTGEARTSRWLAATRRRLGDRASAEHFYLRALNLCEQVGDRNGVFLIAADLGELYRQEGHTSEARKHYQRALMELRRSSRQELDSVSELLRSLHDEGADLAKPLETFTQPDKPSVATVFDGLSRVAITDRQWSQAISLRMSAYRVGGGRSLSDIVTALRTIRSAAGDTEFASATRDIFGERHTEALMALLKTDPSSEHIAADDVSWLLQPPSDPPDATDVGGGDDEPQIINIWVHEREDAPAVPLVARQPYTLMFQVGMPRPASAAAGDRSIPRSEIPDEGLDTAWVISSTNVAMSATPESAVAVRVAAAGTGSQWMATFDLTVPRHGDSDARSITILPLVETSVRLDVSVHVNGDLYRRLTVDLDVSPPDDDAPAPPPQPASALPEASAISTTVVHGVPLRHIAPEPSADWQAPAARLHLDLRHPQVSLRCDELNLRTVGAWSPDCDVVKLRIDDVRKALDTLRLDHQSYFDTVDAADLARRLEAHQPQHDWAAGPAANPNWSAVSLSNSLRRLAETGYLLYQAVFPSRSEIREAVDSLRPGDMLDVTWLPGGDHISHVPWALMYTQVPPGPGQPIDPAHFLGLRVRLNYVAHAMPLIAGGRALGAKDAVTRAHLLYWGQDAGDSVAAETARHLSELSAWNPYVLPSAVPGKPQVTQFLYDPAPAPVGLVYFYCRSVTEEGSTPGLRFDRAISPDDTVRLDEFGVRPFDPSRPLIFANACGTAAARPYRPNELEAHFFSRGCSAFIGTECKVPIGFAARFATAFFTFLYTDDEKRPTPAGEALAQARRFFWTEYGILGGLFYTYVNDYNVYLAADEMVTSLSPVGVPK
jgi:tetratricopeptide (TPR) repeat protein